MTRYSKNVRRHVFFRYPLSYLHSLCISLGQVPYTAFTKRRLRKLKYFHHCVTFSGNTFQFLK